MAKTNLFSRLLIGAAASAVIAAPLMAAPRLTPQAELDKALAGRVAGKPVRCIDPRTNDNTRIIHKTAIVYGSGRTIYLQRPSGAESLRDDDVLVTELRGNGQLCNIDIVQLLDRNGAWYRGFVGLNEFVPYTKVAQN